MVAILELKMLWWRKEIREILGTKKGVQGLPYSLQRR